MSAILRFALGPRLQDGTLFWETEEEENGPCSSLHSYVLSDATRRLALWLLVSYKEDIIYLMSKTYIPSILFHKS